MSRITDKIIKRDVKDPVGPRRERNSPKPKSKLKAKPKSERLDNIARVERERVEENAKIKQERLGRIDKQATNQLKTRKEGTRKELSRASDVRKQEKARVLNQEKNRERVRKGKATKADPGTVRPTSIWEKIAEDRLYKQLSEIGDTHDNIDKFQRKRIIGFIVIILLGCLAGIFLHKFLFLSGPIIGFFMYKMKIKKVDSFYKAWKFERQLNFLKFIRLVIPYLKASGGNAALYTIFNKILQRTENEADRKSLYTLMGEMGDNPASIEPFTSYAERSSGADMSHLFMSTIFDFQQSTFDTSVIDELGQMVSEEMMESIDDIIAMKIRRFNMFPTKLIMSSFILVAGLGVGMMLHNFKDIGFSTDALDISVPEMETFDDSGKTIDPDETDEPNNE